MNDDDGSGNTDNGELNTAIHMVSWSTCGITLPLYCLLNFLFTTCSTLRLSLGKREVNNNKKY